MNTHWRFLVTGTLLLSFSLLIDQELRSGECASSNYFPGSYGDFGVALAPNTGDEVHADLMA